MLLYLLNNKIIVKFNFKGVNQVKTKKEVANQLSTYKNNSLGITIAPGDMKLHVDP